MKFIDLYTDEVFTVADLKRDYIELKKEDSENHAETFKVEFFEILMATINGRNDVEIIGATAKEINNYILRLRSEIMGTAAPGKNSISDDVFPFISSLFADGREKVPYDIETAKNDLKQWENEGVEIPEGLTAETLKTEFNKMLGGC